MAQTPIRIGLAGALGQMGGTIAGVIEEFSDLEIAGLFDRPEAQDAPMSERESVLRACDVVIDFSSAAASADLARRCAEVGRPALVIGSTGFSSAEEKAVRAAAKRIRIVKSGNFSLAVNLLARMVREAAAALPAALYDIEVFEAHHRRKRDAPSGTAVLLGRAAASGRGVDLAKVEVRSRDGAGEPRADGQIGFSVMRGGGLVGEHSVSFHGEDETLTLSHSARDRRLFARGALMAARFAALGGPGLFDMQDVMAAAAPRSTG